MSKFFALATVTAISCTTVNRDMNYAAIKLPTLPVTHIRPIDDPFWETPSNWPRRISNGRQLFILDVCKPGGDSKRMSYGLDESELVDGYDYGEDEVFFGPFFTFDLSDNIRVKGFCHDGYHETHLYNKSKVRVSSKFVDFAVNRLIIILYDNEGRMIGYSDGQDNYDVEFTGTSTAEILGREVSLDEFMDYYISRFQND